MLGAQKKGLRSNPASRWPRSRPFGNAVVGVPPTTSVVPLGGRRPQADSGGRNHGGSTRDTLNHRTAPPLVCST